MNEYDARAASRSGFRDRRNEGAGKDELLRANNIDPMALRAGRLCSYAVMLEPVMMHSWAGSRYSRSEYRIATSCHHTNGDNLVKSGGCTDIAIFNTQDSKRKSHGESGSGPQSHLKA